MVSNILCGLGSKQGNVHRSVSMIEHDSCKETTSLKTELRVIQRKYDSVVKKLKKMEQERDEITNVEDNSNEDGFENDKKRALDEEKEREYEVIKQKYEDAVKEVCGKRVCLFAF